MVKRDNPSDPENDDDDPRKENDQSRAAHGPELNAEGEAALRQLASLLSELTQPIPITFQPSPPEAETKLKRDINKRLVESRPVTVAFPNCADVMLGLIKATNSDEITRLFNDYFMFCDHRVVAETDTLDEVLDENLVRCTGKWFDGTSVSECKDGGVELLLHTESTGFAAPWPPFWCFSPTCITLAGKRHLYGDAEIPAPFKVQRLFIADLVWLFYFERLGIFQILGKILDDYAYTGVHPISNGSLRAGSEDDVVAVVLEGMVRQTEAGTSSKVRDRNRAFINALGWTSEVGRKLSQTTKASREFSTYFHQFLQKATRFYNDKRLAVAIRSTASPSVQPSTETLTAISVTLGELKKTFERFHYGRNYTNTLAGIVWVIGAMALIEELREDLGIPRAYGDPHEFIPAAYNILVLEDRNAPVETSRYENHKICAEAARDILLDVELIEHSDTDLGGELDLWLTLIEGRVEAYRSAYKNLTGTDLAMPQTQVIEQQVIQQQV